MYRCHLRLARSLVAVLLVGVLAPGCASLGGHPAPAALGAEVGKHRSIKDDLAPPQAGPEPKAPLPQARRPIRPASAPEPPACATDAACLAVLKAMVADPQRRWIGQPDAPADYAKGTRLFAYRALHDKLSCRELATALDDMAGAAKTFRTPVPGVTPAQAGRVLALNAAVDGELRTERARRCRG